MLHLKNPKPKKRRKKIIYKKKRDFSFEKSRQLTKNKTPLSKIKNIEKIKPKSQIEQRAIPKIKAKTENEK